MPTPHAAHPDELVHGHLHLVTHIVNQVALRFPRHVDRAELWNAGAFGLVEASRRYDPETGTPFASFARRRIRGAVLDSTRSRDWVSRGARRRMREAKDGRDAFVARHSREPETTELADLLGVSTRHLEETQAATTQSTLLHLDQRVGAVEDDLTLGDTLAEQDVATLPEEEVERRELVGAVRAAIANLPEVHRAIVERYYLGGEQLQDIAASFDVTDARISQLRNEAMTAVRAYLSNSFDGIDAVDPRAPGARRRTAYLDSMRQVSWRDYLDAADTPDASALLAAA